MRKEFSKNVEWSVECKIEGRGYLTVMAKTKEEAEELAWKQYQAGAEVQDFEWGVDDMSAEVADGVR